MDESTNREFTYIRDIELSTKLRDNFGFMCDVDSTLYCNFQDYAPCGLIEYKHWKVSNPRKLMNAPKTVVQRKLADAAGIPLTLVIYRPKTLQKPWMWLCIGMNKPAIEALGTAEPVRMSDQHFHAYHARQRHLIERQGFSDFIDDWIHPDLIGFKGVS